MDLEALRTFSVLSQTLSFREAARRLGVSQPSVSRHLKTLEEFLGADLLLRDRRRVELTPAGRDLRSRVAPLIESMERAVRETAEGQKGVVGTIRFGCLREIGQFFFLKLLTEFQKAHPQVDLRIRLFDEESPIAEHVRDGELDFGVGSSLLLGETVRAYPLVDEAIVLVTRASNDAKLTRVSSARFIGYTDRDILLDQYLKRYYPSTDLREVRRFSTVNSHRAIVELLLASDSYAVLPYLSVRELIAEGKLKIASDKRLKNTLYLLHPEQGHAPERITAFSSHLRERCKAELKEQKPE